MLLVRPWDWQADQDSETLKSTDKICRQLIYHLTPHSKWLRKNPSHKCFSTRHIIRGGRWSGGGPGDGTEGQVHGVEARLETEVDRGNRAEPAEHVAKAKQARLVARAELMGLKKLHLSGAEDPHGRTDVHRSRADGTEDPHGGTEVHHYRADWTEDPRGGAKDQHSRLGGTGDFRGVAEDNPGVAEDHRCRLRESPSVSPQPLLSGTATPLDPLGDISS
ncbi:hypothetical protein PO909_018110 [Leuciscus waleckii]